MNNSRSTLNQIKFSWVKDLREFQLVFNIVLVEHTKLLHKQFSLIYFLFHIDYKLYEDINLPMNIDLGNHRII